VTFYSRLASFPLGSTKISLCLGTACYVRGSGQILEKLKENLGINEGETTSDGMFSLEAARCLGACALAPVMMINGEVYGRLTPDEAVKVIQRIKNKISLRLPLRLSKSGRSMKELALYVLDLAQNSVVAGAKHITH